MKAGIDERIRSVVAAIPSRNGRREQVDSTAQQITAASLDLPDPAEAGSADAEPADAEPADAGHGRMDAGPSDLPAAGYDVEQQIALTERVAMLLDRLRLLSAAHMRLHALTTDTRMALPVIRFPVAVNGELQAVEIDLQAVENWMGSPPSPESRYGMLGDWLRYVIEHELRTSAVLASAAIDLAQYMRDGAEQTPDG